jgi:hypothetical protein
MRRGRALLRCTPGRETRWRLERVGWDVLSDIRHMCV